MIYYSCGCPFCRGSLLREECLIGEECLIPPAAARLPYQRFSLRLSVSVAVRNSSSLGGFGDLRTHNVRQRQANSRHEAQIEHNVELQDAFVFLPTRVVALGLFLSVLTGTHKTRELQSRAWRAATCCAIRAIR